MCKIKNKINIDTKMLIFIHKILEKCNTFLVKNNKVNN